MAQSGESSAGAQLANAGAGSDKNASALYETAYPKPLRDGEEALLQKRPKWQGQSLDRRKFIGFGLSGGGIRSATFCLGVFQALAKLGLLGEIDYISSVSGGSYFASFYGRLFTRPDISKDEGIKEIEKILSPDEAIRMAVGKSGAWKAGIFDWLRENGRYLAPKGGGDLLLAIAVFLRNWLTIQLIIATAVLAFFLAAQLLRVVGEMIYYGPSPVLSPKIRWRWDLRPGVAWAKLSALVHSIGWSGLPATAWGKFATFISYLIHRTPAVPPAQGPFWWSPYLTVAATAMALLSILPLGWAYWMFRQPEPEPSGSASGSTGRPISVLAILAMLTFFIAMAVVASQLPDARVAAAGIVAAGADVVIALLFLLWVTKVKFPRGRNHGSPAKDGLQRIGTLEDEVLDRSEQARNWLSATLRTALVWTVAVSAFGLIDSAGQTLYARFFCGGCHPVSSLTAIYGALAAAAPFAQWVAASLLPKKSTSISRYRLASSPARAPRS